MFVIDDSMLYWWLYALLSIDVIQKYVWFVQRIMAREHKAQHILYD
jgi:hypothetical protein